MGVISDGQQYGRKISTIPKFPRISGKALKPTNKQNIEFRKYFILWIRVSVSMRHISESWHYMSHCNITEAYLEWCVINDSRTKAGSFGYFIIALRTALLLVNFPLRNNYVILMTSFVHNKPIPVCSKPISRYRFDFWRNKRVSSFEYSHTCNAFNISPGDAPEFDDNKSEYAERKSFRISIYRLRHRYSRNHYVIVTT